MKKKKTLGQIAYEAYCYGNWRAIDENEREIWEQAAKTVVRVHKRREEQNAREEGWA